MPRHRQHTGAMQATMTPDWLRTAYDVEALVGLHPLYGTPLVALAAGEDLPGD